MIKELIDPQKSTTNFDLDLILLDLHKYLSRTELINPLRFSHEHDLKLVSIWVIIDVLG